MVAAAPARKTHSLNAELTRRASVHKQQTHLLVPPTRAPSGGRLAALGAHESDKNHKRKLTLVTSVILESRYASRTQFSSQT